MIARAVGTLAVAAAVIAAVVVVPTTYPPAAGRVSVVDVVPGDQPLACPGSMVLPVGDPGAASGQIGAGSNDIRFSLYATSAADPVAVGAGWASQSELSTSIERVGTGDIAGLAALACTEPTNDAWLVGGATTRGNSVRMVLTNPTTSPSEVTITIHGPAGAVSRQVFTAVGAGAQQALLLEGVAAELFAIVVHVEASAAGVVAALQDSRLDGFLPAGSDWVGPSPQPAMSLVISAVGPSDADGAGSSVVRLLAPDGADVSLRLFDRLGEVAWPGIQTLELEAGTVVDLTVPDVDGGAVVIEADAPVIAAAFSQRSRAPEEGLEDDVARDFVWVAAQPRRDDRDLQLMVPHYERWVDAYAYEATTLEVVDVRRNVVVLERDMLAGTAIHMPLTVSSGALIRVDGAVSWVVIVEDEPGFATAVEPTDVTIEALPISVAPATYSSGR